MTHCETMKRCECIGFEDNQGPHSPSWSLNKDLSLIGGKLKCSSDDRKKCRDFCFQLVRLTNLLLIN